MRLEKIESSKYKLIFVTAEEILSRPFFSVSFCSVTRVTRLASQTQLSIVFHRKVLGC